jgi:hypothetical protein
MVRVHNNNAAVMLTGWRNPRRGPGAFVAMTRERADAVIQLPSTMLYGEHKRIVELAAKSRLANIDKLSPEALMQSWFTFDPKLAERFQDLFAAIMAGLGGTRTSSDKK